MNYLTEILAFNDSLLSNPLSAGQINLWYALMYINNKCSWAEWFTAPNRTLELLTGLSRQGIIKNRNVLKQLHFIDFRTNGTKSTQYKMNTMSNSLQDGLQSSLQGSLQRSVQDSLQRSSTLNKQNKTKQNETIYPAAMRAREDDPAAAVLREYETYIGMVTPNVQDGIDAYLADGVEADLLIALISYAAEQGKRSWQYVQGAADGNLRDGIKTLSAYKRKQAERAQSRQASQNPAVKKSRFNNYEDANKPDCSMLEEKLMDLMLENGGIDP